jgi:hypothetical protein
MTKKPRKSPRKFDLSQHAERGIGKPQKPQQKSLKHCGANAQGGGGFQPGNTCGKDEGGTATAEDEDAAEVAHIEAKEFEYRTFEEQAKLWRTKNNTKGELKKPEGRIGVPGELDGLKKADLTDSQHKLMERYIEPGGGYSEVKKKGEAWVKSGRDADLNGIFDATQLALQGWDGKHAHVYRGAVLDASHPLAADIMAGTVGPGSLIDATGGTFESWSTDFTEARQFSSAALLKKQKLGIVLERIAPKKDAVMVGKLLPTTVRRYEEGEWVFRNAEVQGKYRIAGVYVGSRFLKADD